MGRAIITKLLTVNLKGELATMGAPLDKKMFEFLDV